MSNGVTTPVRPVVPLAVDASTPTDRALAMSADGRFVGFDDTDDGSGELVVLDRVAQTRVAEVPPTGAHPGISADGCVIAFSQTDADALRVVDRCATPVATIDVAPLPAGAALPAPAVSADGSVIAWSSGDALLRFVRSGTGYARDTAFAPAKAAGRFFGPRLAMSGDGRSLAYETTSDADETDPASTALHLWTAPAAAGAGTSVQVAAGARFPTIDATGDLIAYERRTSSGASAVEVHHRSASGGPAVIRTLDAAWKPSLSSDGHQLVYDQADGLHVTWWSAASPFNTISSVRLLDGLSTGDGAPGNSGPGAAVSADGRVVVASGDQSTAPVTPPLATGTYLWQHVRPHTVTAATPVDLGIVAVGATASGTATFTNTGQVGIPLTRAGAAGAVTRLRPTVAGAVVAGSWSCDAVDIWQPGTSCTQGVSIVPGAAGVATGTTRLQLPAVPAAGVPAIDVSVTVTATGRAPSTTTSTTTTTVAPEVTVSPTTPDSTLPTGTVPVRTVFPLPSDPIFTGGSSGSYGSGSYGSGGSYSPGSSSSGSTSATTTTTVPELPSFEPPSFEFVPTIIGAGRRTSELALYNPGPDPVTVTALAIDPAAEGHFAVGTTDCTGIEIQPQARCTIEVTFAPTAVGELTATLVASFADGRSADAVLSGLGADEPVLTVEPEVAADGQVVSVFGAGFPAGATVTLTWDDGRLSSEHVVTDAGDFADNMTVLPHTPRGPSELVVTGQDGLFADVAAELLIDVTARRADSAVFGKYNR